MKTIILIWNPAKFTWDDPDLAIQQIEVSGSYQRRWGSGSTRNIEPGSRFFMHKQGPEPRGLIGSGLIIRQPYEYAHWDGSGRQTLYVDVKFDYLSDTPVIGIDELQEGPLAAQGWRNIFSGGTQMKPEVAQEVARLWADRTGISIPSAQSEWSEEELRDSISEYLRLRQAERDGERVVKAQVYRDLSGKHGRSAKAFEYRMQNISYIMDLQGRSWVKGLKPMSNVGTAQIERIEGILAEIENRVPDAEVSFAAEVRRSVRSAPQDSRPEGNQRPGRTEARVTSYQRDPQIVVWVLRNAAGVCELCGENAPFMRTDGVPYLEVHHVEPLGDGGADTISNAVALCPNCHRAVHHAQNRDELTQRIRDRVSRIESL